jgi:hypothetical protein
MRKTLALILAALGFFVLPVRAEVIYAHPVAWQIKSKLPRVGTITLFGSLHILPANMDWLTPDIMHAVSRTDMFVFEVPTDPSSEETLNGMINARGTLPPGQSLRSLLPADYQGDYDAVIAAAHLSPAVTDREQPWLVALQLTLAETMNRNYYPDAGVDYVLMSWANAHTRSVRYLETIDQQFALLTPPDNDLTLNDFEADLKLLEQDQDTIQPLVQAWSDGDVAKLGALMDANFAAHPLAKKKLLTDRNRQWADQIEKMAGDGRNYFITVGAAHLAGADGVPALLRKDGYVVDGP